jgi:hypothetical protein
MQIDKLKDPVRQLKPEVDVLIANRNELSSALFNATKPLILSQLSEQYGFDSRDDMLDWLAKH